MGKNKQNIDFSKFGYYEPVLKAIDFKYGSEIAKLTTFFIKRHYKAEGGAVTDSIAYISANTLIKERTLKRKLKQLEKLKVINKIKTYGQPNTYFVNIEVVKLLVEDAQVEAEIFIKETFAKAKESKEEMEAYIKERQEESIITMRKFLKVGLKNAKVEMKNANDGLKNAKHGNEKCQVGKMLDQKMPKEVMKNANLASIHNTSIHNTINHNTTTKKNEQKSNDKNFVVVDKNGFNITKDKVISKEGEVVYESNKNDKIIRDKFFSKIKEATERTGGIYHKSLDERLHRLPTHLLTNLPTGANYLTINVQKDDILTKVLEGGNTKATLARAIEEAENKVLSGKYVYDIKRIYRLRNSKSKVLTLDESDFDFETEDLENI